MANEQEFKLLITGDAKSAVDAFDQTGQAADGLKENTGDLAKEMGVVNVSQEDVAASATSVGEKTEEAGKKVEEAGDRANKSGEKHKALRRIMGELDRICPGLGEAMHLVSSAYLEAGESAEAGAVGAREFDVALKEVLLTMGPLIIAMLGIEAVMEYWDMYKDKVEAAAKANEEATKRIVDSTHEAFKAVKELDEAMHPEKKDTAGKDEEQLKKQQQGLENYYNRQRELNRANEEKELSGAGSDDAKDAIKKRFEVIDAQLDDWRNKQKAAIEGAMIGTMEKQLADLKAATDKLTEKEVKEYKVAKDAVGTSHQDEAANKLKGTQEEMTKNAEEAKSLREKLDELTGQHETDQGNADFNSETNRQKFGVEGMAYQKPNAGGAAPAPDLQRDAAANDFATGQSIASNAASGGKVSDSQQQFLTVLEETLTGHKLTFDQAVQLMQKQAGHSDQAVSLLQNLFTRSQVTESKLKQLEGQMRNVGHSTK